MENLHGLHSNTCKLSANAHLIVWRKFISRPHTGQMTSGVAFSVIAHSSMLPRVPAMTRINFAARQVAHPVRTVTNTQPSRASKSSTSAGRTGRALA